MFVPLDSKVWSPTPDLVQLGAQPVQLERGHPARIKRHVHQYRAISLDTLVPREAVCVTLVTLALSTMSTETSQDVNYNCTHTHCVKCDFG